MKINVVKDLRFDWVGFIMESTRDEIIAKFSELPENTEFDCDSGYEHAEGSAFHRVEESDEEYNYRIQAELEQRKRALDIAEKKRREDQAKVDKTVADLKKQIAKLEKDRPK